MRVFLFLILLLLAVPASAAKEDPALEARAVKIGSELRCLVCPSGSINDSPAELAGDLRHLIRTKLEEGWEDKTILDYIHQRYGDFVLLNPPLKTGTLGLWLAPWLVLATALGGFAVFIRKKRMGQKS
jgi:cytochrome c-type biogenesis protein CcmH